MFPALDADQIAARTAERWDLDGPLPTPVEGWLSCPICGCEVVQARFWRFHRREQATVAGRCDISFKCTSCAYVWTHGIALDPDVWGRMARSIGRNIGWRQARKLLDGRPDR